MLEFLARWWAKKYSLPSNHKLFLQESPYYWLCEYYLDVFDSKPIESYRNADGEIQFTDTGDELIDKWEEMIAAGESPDLTEAFSPDALKQAQARLAKANRDKMHEDISIGTTVKEMLALERSMLAETQKGTTKKYYGPTFGNGDD